MRVALALCLWLAACGSGHLPPLQAPAVRGPGEANLPALPKAPPPLASESEDLFVAVPRVIAAINRKRNSQGSASLRIDATLSTVAARAVRYAARFGQGQGTEKRVSDDATAQLSRFALVFRSVVAATLFTDQFEDAAGLDPGLDPSMRYAGIGVEPVDSYGVQYAIVVLVGQ